MSKYPPYACQCCGFTNADMFWDRDGERTEPEIAEFNVYRKMWYILNDERQQVKNERSTYGAFGLRKHTDATRAKISATRKANFATPKKSKPLGDKK